MDSEIPTETHDTAFSNPNENIPPTSEEDSKNELGAEFGKEIQDAVSSDQTSSNKDDIIEDDKEMEVQKKYEVISADNDSEEDNIKSSSAVDVTESENVKSSEDKNTVTVTSVEVKDSCKNSSENEKAVTDISLTVKVDDAELSAGEKIETKYPGTETNSQEEPRENEDDEEDDEIEDSDNSSEDAVKEEANKKAEKVEDAKVAEQQQPPEVANRVKTELVIQEVKNICTNDISNQIENIISDIDINIKAQEKIAQLKEQELQLIEKQKQLANQIHQQQILAQKLIEQNQIKENELNRAQEIQQQQLHYRNIDNYRNESVPKVTEQYTNNYKKMQDDIYKAKESSNLSRTVDLRKIFTPATDAPQILPKNRKLYASSAFYSPTLHPTVEDQVELARRISHSLSDISNQKSKGQSMFVNRKKRSVKWVHEGSLQGEDNIEIENPPLFKENSEVNTCKELTQLDKLPLKLIMNPRGQMRDYNSLKDSINIEAGLLSPENCAELITALQLHKGRGAELFAKRRRKADNWVVDETNAGTHSPSGIPDYQQYQAKPPSSPSILPAYSDAGKHRVQLNLHQDQVLEKYSKPGVTVVKSPWEAALQTGSASSAFLQDPTYSSRQTPISPFDSPLHFNRDVIDYSEPIRESTRTPTCYDNILSNNKSQDSNKNINDTGFNNQPILPYNPQRELAYKPNVAQGWGGRNVELPRVIIDCNEEVLQRLHQLELFQQRLTFEFGLGVEDNNPFMPIIPTVSKSCEKDNNNVENNEFVSVRELIHSFEMQSLADYDENKNITSINNGEPRLTDNEHMSVLETEDTSTVEGLYVPKEISLNSYAPPPVQTKYQEPFHSHQQAASVANYVKGSASEIGALGLYSPQPPKQQLYGPQSYVKVPTNSLETTHHATFNPSPLPFEKLSKFQETTNTRSPNQSCLNAGKQHGYNNRRNVTPTLFGTERENRNYHPQLLHNKNKGVSPPSFSSQSFNNCARGWSMRSSVERNSVFGPKVVVANRLPYSDF